VIKMYADILIITDGFGDFDQVLSYRIPQSMNIEAGFLVSIPVRKKIMKGLVLFVQEGKPALKIIKDVYQVLAEEAVVTASGLKLGKWIADYYICSLNKAMQLFFPPPVRMKEKTVYLSNSQSLMDGLLLQEKEKEILKILEQYQEKGLTCQEIKRKMKLPVQKDLEYMVKDNYIRMKKTFVPQIVKKEKVIVSIKGYYADMAEACKNAPKQKAILNILKDVPHSLSELKEKGVYNRASLKALYDKNFIKIEREDLERNPFQERLKKERPELLNEEQKMACKVICNSIKNGYEKWLLFGVTGSGKTEVFLQAIEEVLKLGRQVLYMVPEISLTPQVIALLLDTFGEEVAVLHSALAPGERYDEWMKIKEGRARVVLGPRSAVFAPFTDLGLIIIDEEHENTYKQSEPAPRYDARCVAEKLAELFGATLVIGSATPSLKSFQKVYKGQYGVLKMSHRVSSRPMPSIKIIDMKKEIKKGNTSIFSEELMESLQKTLDAGKQAILFMNRRGFHTYVMCRECGKPLTCPHCSITLNYHHSKSKLICHYCNYQQPIPKGCPFCGSSYVRYYGTGTERVAEEFSKVFPNTHFVRMDADTTHKKDSHLKILKEFQEGKAKVLIGTQMVAKGLDFPKVTLVGVINSDFLLNMPDYQAGERAYQLLTQVAGRAGRGNELGKVLIQTYEPDNYLFSAIQEQNYEKFFKKEISNREILQYPPFCSLLRILVSGYSEEQVLKRIEEWEVILKKEILNFKEQIEILGPTVAPLGLIRERFRYHIIVKGVDLGNLQKLALIIREKAKEYSAEPRTIIDIEPQNLL